MSRLRGFTLAELLVVIVMVGLLTGVAVPMYQQYSSRARLAAAIKDIGAISLAVERYRLANRDWVPNSLADLSMDIPKDPWGRDYRFLRLQDGGNLGAARKDGRLVPLNSDFDLYSIGDDGVTAAPLSASSARDDIVRANNGSFIGLGKDY